MGTWRPRDARVARSTSPRCRRAPVSNWRSRMQRTRVAAVAVVVAATMAGSTVAGAQAASGRHDDRGRIRNVIYLLGDGMGRTHVTAGRNRFYGPAGRLNMERLPVIGQVSTYAVEKRSGQP